jgi:hypothetical protein
MHARGVGLMENPSLMKRGGWYYWHESVNGTVTWGLAPDPNAGPASSNKGALAVWRSKTIAGPYEGPRDLIKSNVGAACVNTGTVVLGPDNTSWYYLYDAIVPGRWNMQRQMFVDKISFGADGWPIPRTPGGRNKIPAGGVSPPLAERWRPQLTDEFEGAELEGVTGGVLGRKWLFKQENESLWSLGGRRQAGGARALAEAGALGLRTDCKPGIESPSPANLLLQRSTAAYYRLETNLRWPTSSAGRGTATAGMAGGSADEGGAGGRAGVRCDDPGASAGLIARELNTGTGIAVGLQCNATTRTLQLVAWQDTLNLLHAVPFPGAGSDNGNVSGSGRESVPAAGDFYAPAPGGYHEIRLRIDVELVLAQVWYSVGNGPWQALPAFHTGSRGSEMTFEYASTYMSWTAVGPDPAAWQHVDVSTPRDAFTTLHPGLFAGGGEGSSGGGGHMVFFDYFRYTDNEVFPVDEV